MVWKRSIVSFGVLWALATFGGAALAEEPPAPKATPGATDATSEKQKPAPEEKKKGHWWDERFALYVETAGGKGSGAKDLDTSIVNSVKNTAETAVDLKDLTFARLAVGWTLPAGRGTFLVVFTGYKEDGYTLTSEGFTNHTWNDRLNQDNDQAPLIRWWQLSIEDGQLRSARNRPNWVPFDAANPAAPFDDKNHDGRPSQDEVRYGTPDEVFTRGVPDNLENRPRTYDLLYQRDFGGLRASGRWSAGWRYFDYEGNVAAGTWLGAYATGEGFTDGDLIHLLTFREKTTGMGPTGSLEAQGHLFRGRLTLYGQGRIALLVERAQADTGVFNTFLPSKSGTALYLMPSRLVQRRSKTAWQVGGELGLRVKIVEGFEAHMAYNRTSFQDSVLVPTQVILGQLQQGTSALYNTRDLILDAWQLGFSYQF